MPPVITGPSFGSVYPRRLAYSSSVTGLLPGPMATRPSSSSICSHARGGKAASGSSGPAPAELGDVAGEAARQRRHARREDVRKTEFVAQSRGYQARVAALEREVDTARLELKLDDAGLELKQLHDRRAEERFEEERELLEQTRRIKLSIAKLRQCIQEEGTADVERLKSCMDAAEFELLAFRNRQHSRLDALNSEEKELSRDLAACVKRFEGWVHGAQDAGGHSAKFGKADQTVDGPTKEIVSGDEQDSGSQRQLPPEVLAFQKFLDSRGGHTGGWDPRDHADFLRLYSRHSSAPEVLVERASREIIGQVTTAIQEHIEWYKRYLELQIRQREAIRLWKEGKKSKIIAVVEDAVQTTDASFERRRKQEAEEAHLREREEKLQRLAAWKAQKRKEVEEKCQKKMQQDEEHRKQLTTVQKRQSALKEQVTQYQREKQAAKQARKEAEEAAEEAAKAAARGVRRDPSALWERDKLLALRRQEIKLQELSAQVERCERQARILAQVPVPCVARDFNRLVAPTESEQNRTTPVQARAFGFPKEPLLLNAAQRATPSWRAVL